MSSGELDVRLAAIAKLTAELERGVLALAKVTTEVPGSVRPAGDPAGNGEGHDADAWPR